MVVKKKTPTRTTNTRTTASKTKSTVNMKGKGAAGPSRPPKEMSKPPGGSKPGGKGGKKGC